jgi:uncharacterized membrane protein
MFAARSQCCAAQLMNGAKKQKPDVLWTLLQLKSIIFYLIVTTSSVKMTLTSSMQGVTYAAHQEMHIIRLYPQSFDSN